MEGVGWVDCGGGGRWKRCDHAYLGRERGGEGEGEGEGEEPLATFRQISGRC